MIARKSALIITTSILDGVLAYVALFFITKYMGPLDYGIVGFAMSFVSLFVIFGRMGFEEAHIKKVSEGKDLGTCIGTFLVIKIGLVGLMTLIIAGSILFWKFYMGRGFETSTHELAVYVMIGLWAVRLFLKQKRRLLRLELPIF